MAERKKLILPTGTHDGEIVFDNGTRVNTSAENEPLEVVGTEPPKDKPELQSAPSFHQRLGVSATETLLRQGRQGLPSIR